MGRAHKPTYWAKAQTTEDTGQSPGAARDGNGNDPGCRRRAAKTRLKSGAEAAAQPVIFPEFA